MRKRRFRVLGLLLPLALVAAACGGDDDSDDAAEEEEEDATPFEAISYDESAGVRNARVRGHRWPASRRSTSTRSTFTLCNPDVAFPSKVAFAAMHIYPSEALDEIPAGGPNPLVDNPIGTGPFKLQAWERGSQIVLERNEDYWGEAPTLRHRRVPVADRGHPAPAPARERRGPRHRQRRQRGLRGPRAAIPTSSCSSARPPNVAYLGMNVDVAPFDNEQVRQAIGLAIDRDRLVENFYPGRLRGGDPVPARRRSPATPTGSPTSSSTGTRQGTCWPRPASPTGSTSR